MVQPDTRKTQQPPPPPGRPQTVTAGAGMAGSGLSFGVKLTMALVALFLGLLTPPLLVKAERVETMKGENEDEVCFVNETGDYVCATQTLGSQKALFPCEKDVLNAYLNVEPFPGYHVVCFSQVHNEEQDAKDFVQVTYYLDGFWNKTVTQTFPAPYNKWKNVKKGMERHMKSELRNALEAGFQPWAIFTPLGNRVIDADADLDNEEEGEMIMEVLLTYQTMLVFEGGQFIWPGIHKGFIRQVPLYSVMPMGDPDMTDKSTVVSLQTVSIRPLVLAVDGFLSDEECDYIQNKAEPDMEYSSVVLMDKDKGRPASDFRTSQTAFVAATADDALLDIEYRVASLTRVPRMHQESVQVLRYGVGEKYDHHHDYFDPRMYQEDEDTMETIAHGRRNRLATVLWYLSDVEKGGQTTFPQYEGMTPVDSQDCETGIQVNPAKGRVILFYSLLANGQYDPLSLHGACPVEKGIKWAGNKWMWNEPMDYVEDFDTEDIYDYE